MLTTSYCRIPVAIIIVLGICIIVGCICCIKGCADCIACCFCCRSSKRTRERLRPPEQQPYAPSNYNYAQQPAPYPPVNNRLSAKNGTPGNGTLFPMPERPKYERLGDEENGINLNEIPKQAYLDGDQVVSEPPVKEEETQHEDTAAEPFTNVAPIAGAAAVDAGVTGGRMSRPPTAAYSPYGSNAEGSYFPPSVPAGRTASPRREYPRPSYEAPYSAGSGYAYSNRPYESPQQSPYDNSRRYDSRPQQQYENWNSSHEQLNSSYDTSYNNGGGGYRDEQEPYYYENGRGGYGGRRGGGYVV